MIESVLTFWLYCFVNWRNLSISIELIRESYLHILIILLHELKNLFVSFYSYFRRRKYYFVFVKFPEYFKMQYSLVYPTHLKKFSWFFSRFWFKVKILTTVWEKKKKNIVRFDFPQTRGRLESMNTKISPLT